MLPIDVNNGSIVYHSRLVCLNGTKARQVPPRIQGDRLELTGNPLADGLIQLPELVGREFGELDPEGQALIPLL